MAKTALSDVPYPDWGPYSKESPSSSSLFARLANEHNNITFIWNNRIGLQYSQQGKGALYAFPQAHGDVRLAMKKGGEEVPDVGSFAEPYVGNAGRAVRVGSSETPDPMGICMSAAIVSAGYDEKKASLQEAFGVFRQAHVLLGRTLHGRFLPHRPDMGVCFAKETANVYGKPGVASCMTAVLAEFPRMAAKAVDEDGNEIFIGEIDAPEKPFMTRRMPGYSPRKMLRGESAETTMPVPSREQLEEQPNWVATFEFTNSPGKYRVLMKHPIGEGLYWHDVSRAALPWQWGITNVYEGDTFLNDVLEGDYMQKVAGELPWELPEGKPEEKIELDMGRIRQEAARHLGMLDDDEE